MLSHVQPATVAREMAFAQRCNTVGRHWGLTVCQRQQNKFRPPACFTERNRVRGAYLKTPEVFSRKQSTSLATSER